MVSEISILSLWLHFAHYFHHACNIIVGCCLRSRKVKREYSPWKTHPAWWYKCLYLQECTQWKQGLFFRGLGFVRISGLVYRTAFLHRYTREEGTTFPLRRLFLFCAQRTPYCGVDDTRLRVGAREKINLQSNLIPARWISANQAPNNLSVNLYVYMLCSTRVVVVSCFFSTIRWI